MLSNTASDDVTALILDGEELSNDELMRIVYDADLSCSASIQADVFTYKGRTLILAYAAAPLRGRFSAVIRFKRNLGKR